MKHDRLHSIAHDYAASVAGGFSFVAGPMLVTHVFAEAAATKDGTLIIDFLKGTGQGVYPGGELEHAIPMFRNGFPAFCAKLGADISDFRAFIVRFTASRSGNTFHVTIEDKNGRRTSRAYYGRRGNRLQTLDPLGRRRPLILPKPVD